MTTATELLQLIGEVRVIKRKAIRKGQLVTIKKTVWSKACPKGMKHNSAGQCVPMSGKERAALMKLHTSGAAASRARSMMLRKRSIHQDDGSYDMGYTTLAVEFYPSDDSSMDIQDVQNVLDSLGVDYSLDDMDVPIQVSVDSSMLDDVVANLSDLDCVENVYELTDGDDTDSYSDDGSSDDYYGDDDGDEGYYESAKGGKEVKPGKDGKK